MQPVSRKWVLGRLRQDVDRMGGQAALASEIGISRQHLSDVLAGRRLPGPAVLTRYALRSMLVYVPDEGQEAA